MTGRLESTMRVSGWFVCVLVGLTMGLRAQAPPPVVPVATPPPFDDWLTALRAEAIERGIASELVDRAFADIKPVEQILDRDRKQAEFTLELDEYLKRRITTPTVRLARQMYAKHRAVLARVEKAYGVPSRIGISLPSISIATLSMPREESVARRCSTVET